MFLPVNFDNLGMTTPQSARVWLMAIVGIIHILLFKLSNLVFNNWKKVLFVNVLFLIWQPFFEGWVLWLDSFLPIFLLSAAIFAIKKKYLIAGFIIGLGVVFKQTLFPFALLFPFYILWERKSFKYFSYYFALTLLPIAVMTVHLLSIGVLADFWYWTIVFNLTEFARDGTKAPATFGFVTRVLFVYCFSFAALFDKQKKIVVILFIFLLGALVGVFDRADFVHFQPSLPFVLLLTVMGFDYIKKKKIFIPLIGIYIFVMLWWQFIFYKGHISDKIFFYDKETLDLVAKIKHYTKEGDTIFVFGGVPHLYQMTDTLPPGGIFIFQFPWFMIVAEDRILQGIIKDKPKIIVSQKDNFIEGMQIKDFASKINTYITENYEIVDKIGEIQILKEKNEKN
jgi:hypothetical protein